MNPIVRITLDGLPPTQNKAYVNKPMIRVGGKMVGGGRRLSSEAKAFKLGVTTQVARTYPFDISDLVPNKPYALHVTFLFPEERLMNKGYPKKTNNKYKKIDALNMAKLLEDAVYEAFGIDDSHNFLVRLEKKVADKEQTIVEVFHHKE